MSHRPGHAVNPGKGKRIPKLYITAPADITLVAAGPTVVSFAGPTVRGGVAPITVTVSPTSGSVFQIGTTTVTCTALDAVGQRAVDIFYVTLILEAPPPPPPPPPPECSVVLGAPSGTIPAVGGVITVALTANYTTCEWAVTTDAPWLSIAPASGMGSVTLDVTGLANANFSTRTGTITLGDGVFVTIAQAAAIPPVVPPATPTGLVALAGDSQVSLMWNASAGAVTYNVKRSTSSGGTYTTIASTSLTSYAAGSLTNGTTYYFKVSATNSGGTSADSSVASATPVAPPTTGFFYVATNGLDSNPGSITQPFRHIAYAVTKLQPGDTLYVRGGTYDEGVSYVPSGTSWSSKVRIANYPGETVWLTPSVFLSGNPGNCIRLQNSAHRYIEFDGINCNGSAMVYGAIAFVSTSGIEQHHIRVKNAEIIASTTVGGDGISTFTGIASALGGNEYQNLTIHGGGRPGGAYTDNGYGIYLDGPNTLIEHCTIYNTKGAGIHAYNDDGGSASNNVIRNNVIRDITRNANIGQLWGIILAGGSNNNQVYNNIIYNINSDPGTNPDGKGIAIGGGVSGNKVWNNTVYNNEGHGIYIDPTATSTEVRNNILYANGTNLVGPATASHNLIGIDPLFVSPGTGDFHLQAGSPAINTGTTVPQVTTDFDGVTRGNPPEIGAYEKV